MFRLGSLLLERYYAIVQLSPNRGLSYIVQILAELLPAKSKTKTSWWITTSSLEARGERKLGKSALGLRAILAKTLPKDVGSFVTQPSRLAL